MIDFQMMDTIEFEVSASASLSVCLSVCVVHRTHRQTHTKAGCELNLAARSYEKMKTNLIGAIDRG